VRWKGSPSQSDFESGAFPDNRPDKLWLRVGERESKHTIESR